MYKEIKGKEVVDYNPEIIAWQRREVDSKNAPLLYVFPQPGDSIKDKKFFAVKDYEKALFYNKGELLGVLGGGVYELEKKAKIKGTEIVWIDTSFIDIQWGIPQSNGIPTKDGIFIGLHGDLRLKINDVKIFYNDVVAGKSVWRVQNLKEWIMSLLNSSLRDIFKNHQAKQVVLEERERVINLITSKVSEEFMKYGLELETLNIIGVKAPEGTEKLFAVEREKGKVSDELEVLQLKKELEAQKMQLESAKKAYKRKEDILDSKMILEKTKLRAEAEQIEGDVKSDLLGKQKEAAVAGEVKLMDTHGEKAIKIAEITSEAKLRENERKEIKQKISELKDKLDKFDDLLAEDKISKDIYKTRVERTEKELKELEKKL
ncbi:MAG: SPFH domain-containing protein [Candidatus Hermodarchaeota archaeon]